ncbi:Unconventional prefoldin RPB5 interactor [Zancudomyces culisetae]|uniref:Unconventional prefoldin RPB5 interactor n=1 Tax=Zancudomyces culisetae TaxID=1213189 RepID=A0A1R1PJS0_ZANCU|nr:Unconventional prefoldin RPB5 interactor [Zancudomyces culisetae]|eukprot:OMH81187.1 Unconventional prefoldin RPB5 interactor [Zancudomyces culisetae]
MQSNTNRSNTAAGASQYQAQLNVYKSTLKQYLEFKEEYVALQETLEDISKEIEYDAMLPFGDVAFIPGKIVRTNEILVLLGDNWFVERSAFQACQIAKRREEFIDEKIRAVENQINGLQGKEKDISDMILAGEQQYNEEGDRIIEIKEDYTEEDEMKQEEQDRQWVAMHTIPENVHKNESVVVNEVFSGTGLANDDELGQQIGIEEQELLDMLRNAELNEVEHEEGEIVEDKNSKKVEETFERTNDDTKNKTAMPTKSTAKFGTKSDPLVNDEKSSGILKPKQSRFKRDLLTKTKDETPIASKNSAKKTVTFNDVQDVAYYEYDSPSSDIHVEERSDVIDLTQLTKKADGEGSKAFSAKTKSNSSVPILLPYQPIEHNENFITPVETHILKSSKANNSIASPVSTSSHDKDMQNFSTRVNKSFDSSFLKTVNDKVVENDEFDVSFTQDEMDSLIQEISREYNNKRESFVNNSNIESAKEISERELLKVEGPKLVDQIEQPSKKHSDDGDFQEFDLSKLDDSDGVPSSVAKAASKVVPSAPVVVSTSVSSPNHASADSDAADSSGLIKPSKKVSRFKAARLANKQL